MLSRDDERLQTVLKYEAKLKGEKIFFEPFEWEDIVLFFLENGKFARARKALAMALKEFPEAFEINLLHVELMIYQEQYDQAEKVLAEFMQDNPYDAELLILHADLLSKQGEHHKAIDDLNKALEYSDTKADIYSMLAWQYVFADDYPKAISCFMECLRYDPKDYFSLEQMVYNCQISEQEQRAITFLDKFLEQNPYCEIGWYHLGRLFMGQYKYNEALLCFDYAIISDDTFTGAYYEKGRTLEHLEKYQLAIDNYKISLIMDDPISGTYTRIGACYEKLKNYPLAKENYLRATYEDPQSSQAWMSLVEYFVKRKEWDKAAMYIPKVLLHNIDDFFIIRRCGEIYTQIANYYKKYNRKIKVKEYLVKALDTFQRIRYSNSFPITFKEEIATLSMELGLYQQAANLLVQVSLEGTDATLLYLKGLALFMTNKPNITRSTLKLSLFPLNTSWELFLKRAYELNPTQLESFKEQFPDIFQDNDILDNFFQANNNNY